MYSTRGLRVWAALPGARSGVHKPSAPQSGRTISDTVGRPASERQRSAGPNYRYEFERPLCLEPDWSGGAIHGHSMPLLTEISADHDHWLGSCGSLAILFWPGDIAPRVCRTLPALAAKLAEREREPKVSVLTLTKPNSSPPNREARLALAAVSRDSAACVARIAIVREGQGFIASALASIAAGIHLLAGATSPHKTFSDLGDAIRWATEPLRQFQSGRCSTGEVLELVVRKQRFFVERA
jgi:hypothetical protein